MQYKPNFNTLRGPKIPEKGKNLVLIRYTVFKFLASKTQLKSFVNKNKKLNSIHRKDVSYIWQKQEKYDEAELKRECDTSFRKQIVQKHKYIW